MSEPDTTEKGLIIFGLRIPPSTVEDEKWIVAQTPLLGDEEVVFVLDDAFAEKAREAEPGKVLYTREEIDELAKCKISPDGLRKVHKIKKLFDGEIVHKDSPLGRTLQQSGLWEW